MLDHHSRTTVPTSHIAAVRREPRRIVHASKLTRRGVAVVEFAVCVPILVVIVFGSLEACNAIYLKQAATASAYEAARVATGTGGTLVAGQTRGQEILTARSLTGTSIAYSPALESQWARGTQVSVTVTVPVNENLNGLSMFFRDMELTATVVMVKQ